MITESVSPIVYHFTEHVNALNIIKTENFRLSPAFRNDVEEEYAKKLYFLSTTRSRQGSYHQGNSSGVLFVIDGNAVNARYKGGPVDYWQRSGMGGDEMEDRIHHTKPLIPIKGIVKGIEVLFDIDNGSEVLARVTYLLYAYAKKNGIAFAAYKNRKDFLTKNKKNAYDHKTLMKMKDGETIDTSYNDKRNVRDALRPERHDLYNFVEIYYRDYEALSKEAKELYHKINEYSDTINSLRADITNATGMSGASPFRRKLVDAIGKLMRKENVDKFSELYNIVKERIKKESKERNERERRNILLKRYNSDKERHDHILSVLETGEGFDRGLFHKDDHTAMMQINGIGDTLIRLDMLSDSTKQRWVQYDGISDTAFEFLFKLKIAY